MLNLVRQLTRRARLLWSRERVERELTDELRHHVEMEAEELVRDGWTPETARREALRRFGGEESTRERVRDARGGRLLLDLIQDVRYAGRQLMKSPGFATSVLVILMLGIGATTAIFSLVDAVLLRPLPYPGAGALVQIWSVSPEGEARERLSGADAAELPQELDSFSAVGMYRNGRTAALTGSGDPELAIVADMQPGVWRTLGVDALVGRTFVEEDAAAERLAIISHSLWRRRYGSDRAVIGQAVRIDDQSYTVVGVMPETFAFPSPEVDVWMPLTPGDPGMDPSDRASRTLLAIGRLTPGVTLEAARAEMATLFARQEAAYPEMRGWSSSVVPLQSDLTAEVRPLLALLLAGAGLVLLIGCGNLSGLLLARGVLRTKEMAVRDALGASRERLVRQLLTEGVLLAVLGGALGVGLASPLLDGFIRLAPDGIPLIGRAGIDLRTLLFTGALSLGCTILFGLLPALRQTRSQTSTALRAGRGSTPAVHVRLRAMLLVGQVALSVVLLIGAGLLIRTFAALTASDLGFDEENLVTMSVALPGSRYQSTEQQTRFMSRLVDEVERIPTAIEVSGSNGPPGFAGINAFYYFVEGRNAETPTGRFDAEDLRYVLPDYFSTIGQRVVRGRGISSDDRVDTPPVVVVNEAFARMVWPDENPVGRRLAIPSFREREQWQEVVGVVENARLGGPDEAEGPRFYMPYAQHDQTWQNWMTLLIRVPPGTNPFAVQEGLRAALLEVDPTLPPRSLGTVEQSYRSRIATRTFAMTLVTSFGAAALLLSIVGLYGLISFGIAQRRREIGLRKALGAQDVDILGATTKQSMILVLSGTGLGILVALLATRAMQSLLYSVESVDLVTYLGTAAVVVGVSLLASGIPAWRATRIDPVSVLSAE